MVKKPLNILGLMSGTSLDGIDLSYVETNGIFLKNKKNFYHPHKKFYKSLFFKILKNPTILLKNIVLKKRLDDLVSLEHFKAIKKSMVLKKVEFIGFHGQTVFHDPKNKITIQLGNPQYLSNLTKKKIVSNFRQKDIDNGGCGAPLAPIYHRHLMEKYNFLLPACLINIGGVSNITYWDGNKLIGFDAGPGNGLIDEYVYISTKKYFDRNGIFASSGNVNYEILNEFSNELFFKKSPPKSLDKHSFKKFYEYILEKQMPFNDTVATLTELTVFSIIEALKILPKYPRSIAVTGGGQKNNYMMESLNKKLKNIKNYNLVLKNKNDFLESELIGYITARHIYKLPTTFFETTGVKKPICGGTLFFPL